MPDKNTDPRTDAQPKSSTWSRFEADHRAELQRSLDPVVFLPDGGWIRKDAIAAITCDGLLASGVIVYLSCGSILTVDLGSVDDVKPWIAVASGTGR